MTKILDVLIKAYSFLIRLYPAAFRREFEEQMLLDFKDMIANASRAGKYALVIFCLKELIDYPVNLLQLHLKEGWIFKILRIQPVNYGLRSALGFGLGLASITPVGLWISRSLYPAFDPMLQSYSIWYYETFGNERWIRLLDSLLAGLVLAFNALFFGLLFAILAGHRSKYSRYLLASALGFFIPLATSHVLSSNFRWSYYLDTNQNFVLSVMISIVTGGFFATIFCIAESERKEPLRYLVLGAFIFPLGTYLFIRLLFDLWLEITPWFFPCLMIWMVLLISSVIALVRFTNRKMLWMVVAGAIGHRLLNYAVFYFVYYLLQFPSAPIGVGIAPEDLTVYLINDAIFQAIAGVLFGLALGLMFAIQMEREQQQISD